MMRKVLSGVVATALAASFAIASTLPLNAAPVYVPKSAPTVSQDVEKVQFRRCAGPGCYRGYRGYRGPRPGYRYYNGWWFPAAAFITGAIIADSLAEPRYRPRDYGRAHVDWCYARYKSYRAYDNTYQPYNGPRRQCISPYS
jgi:hypothetical protein